MARIRLAVPAVVLAAAALLAASPGQAQAPYPDCGAATKPPIWGASGFPEASGASSDLRLFASHPVTVVGGFHFDANASSVTMDPPLAGMTRVTADDLATDGGLGDFDGYADSTVALAEEPGSYPFRLTWIQTDDEGHNPCSGAATTSVTLMAPVAAVRLGKPKDTGGLGGTESTVTLKIPRTGGDLRPLEVRYRAVKKQRAAGPGVDLEQDVEAPQQVLAVLGRDDRLQPSDLDRRPLVVLAESRVALAHGDDDRLPRRARAGEAPYGYDLEIRQAGASVTRLRVAGRCDRNGGSVSCKRKKVKRTP